MINKQEFIKWKVYKVESNVFAPIFKDFTNFILSTNRGVENAGTTKN